MCLYHPSLIDLTRVDSQVKVHNVPLADAMNRELDYMAEINGFDDVDTMFKSKCRVCNNTLDTEEAFFLQDICVCCNGRYNDGDL